MKIYTRKDLAMPTKICNKCGLEKDIDEFYTDVRYIDNRMSSCKDCIREKQRNYSRYKNRYINKNDKVPLSSCSTNKIYTPIIKDSLVYPENFSYK